MPKIYLDWSDGRYYTRQLTDEEAADHEAQGLDVVSIEDAIWQAYERDCQRDAIWQAFWRSISNDQYMRRREKELLPLEDAERKIRQLENDLAQARRMWRYFEEEHDRAKGFDPERWHTAEARSSNDYSCVFPQPGCKIDLLPPKWQARATEIVHNYRADLDTKYQGCCCAYGEHEKLDEKTTQRLRDGGFVVEHDSEPELEEDQVA